MQRQYSSTGPGRYLVPTEGSAPVLLDSPTLCVACSQQELRIAIAMLGRFTVPLSRFKRVPSHAITWYRTDDRGSVIEGMLPHR